jgi:hypothetical protein
MRSNTRQDVGIDATGPATPWRSPKTSTPETQSAPSAIAAATSANTRPGRVLPRSLIGIGQRLGHPGDQAGIAGQFPQHPHPGVRHDPHAIRADLHSPCPLATLHPRSAFL